MKLTEKALRIQAELDRLYPTPAIPLDHSDPYTLLIAVLLSAQCTDKKVNEITPKLFACIELNQVYQTYFRQTKHPLSLYKACKRLDSKNS